MLLHAEGRLLFSCTLFALQAAALGSPYLVSFSGMAEVFGWPESKPIVAPSDRSRVLEAWAQNWNPEGSKVTERVFPFQLVRPLRYIPFCPGYLLDRQDEIRSILIHISLFYAVPRPYQQTPVHFLSDAVISKGRHTTILFVLQIRRFLPHTSMTSMCASEGLSILVFHFQELPVEPDIPLQVQLVLRSCA